MEDTSNTLHLNLNMVYEALPHRLIANCSVTRNRTSLTIVKECDFTKTL